MRQRTGKQTPHASQVFFAQTGCLLPALIMGNLFFGWMFFPFLKWVAIEAVLIAFFILTSVLAARKFVSTYRRYEKDALKDAIDVEAHVVHEQGAGEQQLPGS